MPKLNLKDDAYENEEGGQESGESPAGLPTMRDSNGNGGRVSPIILALVAIIILAAGIFALNYFKVIHLWGKRAPQAIETGPLAEEPLLTTSPDSNVAELPQSLPVPDSGTKAEEPPQTAAPRPEPLPTPKTTTPAGTTGALTPGRGGVRVVPTGDGGFTVQFAAWHSLAKAELQVGLLGGAGYDSYVDEARSRGEHWYRVRVGRFATRAEARPTADRLQNMTEDIVWIARIRSL